MATDIDIIDEATSAAADAYRELVRRVAKTRPGLTAEVRDELTSIIRRSRARRAAVNVPQAPATRSGRAGQDRASGSRTRGAAA